MKLGRGLLISILLFILYFSGSAAALKNPVNATAVAVGPGGEETSGDLGITLLEVGAETIGIEKEDLGIAGAGEEETGNVETEFKVEKGEKSVPDDAETGGVTFGDGITGRVPDSTAGKREIVIVGSKLRGEQGKATDQDHDKWIDILSLTSERGFETILKKDVETEDDLEEYAVAVVASDENIEKVSIGEAGVSMSYRYPAKLLWLLDVNYTMTTTVDMQGRVKVQRPWWLMFSKNNAGDISGELESALTPMGGDGQLANLDLQNAMQKQQQILQTLSNMQKARHDTAMNSIRNMK